jgi:TetR/AcrR family transcriptional regulator
VLETLFEAAAHDHGNMRGRQQRYAASLLGVLTGYAALILQGDVRPDNALCRNVAHQFGHGIYS